MKNLFKYTFLITLSFILLSGGCDENKAEREQRKQEKAMKKELENMSYEDIWKKIDKLDEQGLPKSALALVEQVLQRATKENNQPMIVKATIYKMTYNQTLEDASFVKSLYVIDEAIKESKTPLKQLFISMKAELLSNYLNENIYTISERTTTVGFDLADIETWDIKSLSREIQQLAEASLQDASQLQKIDLKEYVYVLQNTSEQNYKRTPTVYDFLATRALSIFKDERHGLTRPADRFTISDTRYFGSASEFLQIPLTTSDTLSQYLHYVKTLQELTRFNAQKNNPYANMYLALERLNFAKENSLLPNKSELYQKGLENLISSSKNHESVTEATAILASYLMDKREDTSKNYRKEAYQMCQQAVAQYPNSEGAANCKLLIQSLEQQSIHLETQSQQGIMKPLLFKATHCNVTELHALIYENVNHKEIDIYEEMDAQLSKMKLIRSQKISVTDAKDYQNHTTEFALEGLPAGMYTVVLTSNPKSFKKEDGRFDFQPLTITDIVYSINDISNEQSNILVVNRNTGAPIANAEVLVYVSKYDSKKRKEYKTIQNSYKTDANGSATLDKYEDYRSNSLTIKNGQDSVSSAIYLRAYKQGKTVTTSNQLFTDRTIYRPGQKVYFKGIRTQVNDKQQSIVTNEKVTVQLKDVNMQVVAEQTFTTNQYGSFAGVFTLPTSSITGEFQLWTKDGSNSFNVEEYKRPTFKVQVNELTATFKLGDKIRVQGLAEAYAGNKIDNATVDYVVRREVRTPWRRGWWMPTASEEIILKKGSTQTDQEGKYAVEFDAIYDPNREKHTFYVYTVEVTVIDRTGETRSASKSITIGEAALLLSLTSEASMERTGENKLTIISSNQAGVPISSKGEIKFYRLDEGATLFAKRPWEVTDYSLMDEKEFNRLFPQYSYKTPAEPTRQLVATIPYDNSSKTTVSVPTSKWSTGKYIAIASTKDKDGKAVESEVEFTVNDFNQNTPSTLTALSLTAQKTDYRAGEIARIAVASSYAQQFVMLEFYSNGRLISKEFLNLSNSQKIVALPITKDHLGAITVIASSVRHNQPFVETINLSVVEPAENLEVSFETFRSTLLPGSKENWKLRITGPNKERVASEVLVAMYDASLDAFSRSQSYNLNKRYTNYSLASRNFTGFEQSYKYYRNYMFTPYIAPFTVPKLNWFKFNFNSFPGGGHILYETAVNYIRNKSGAPVMEQAFGNIAMDSIADIAEEEVADKVQAEAPDAIRSNFNETAFFYPQMTTDGNGDVLINFEVPEALTTWKVIGLAHSKKLQTVSFEEQVKTQKDVMIQALMPRFARTGDKLTLSAKISNLSSGALDGNARIEIYDALTMSNLTEIFQINNQKTSFNVAKDASTTVEWHLQVPNEPQNILVQVYAKAGTHTDAEEHTLPILSDRVLVTESMPVWINGKGTKDFTFDKLVNEQSSTLQHHALTFEYTENPAWYVIQALPYMMEYPHDCSEQIFTRYYANALASNLVRSSPHLKAVLDEWKNSSPSAFLSNLERNQQLKSVVLEETPWVLEAKDESDRKKRVALLFDFNKMDQELAANLRQLKEVQSPNGGFSWFPGMKESRYITQRIVTGLVHLQQLGVNLQDNDLVVEILRDAILYLDEEVLKDYQELKRSKTKLEDYVPNQIQLYYMYARTYLSDFELNNDNKQVLDYFLKQANDKWLQLGLYNQAMLAISSVNSNKQDKATAIMNSILERAIVSGEMGMYWKENERGYYWYQAPIETQAMLIEAMVKTGRSKQEVNQAKGWLLRNKQTSDWKTTTATADAAYALLLGGNAFAEATTPAIIKINNKEIKPSDFGSQAEAGTGYFQKTWTGKEISKELGKVSITSNNEQLSYGAMYWQYFEDMDKVTASETSLKLNKQLFKVKMTDAGEVMEPIGNNYVLQKGDKVRVRIELRTDRNLEYVHMKDYRAAGFEPKNVLSSYKYQGGLGYYESTRDVATNFFFDYLPKGTYVFEYDMTVFHTGTFTNGFATIQCMYAPEFTSHSQGVKVQIK